jgi:hypothetical protein
VLGRQRSFVDRTGTHAFAADLERIVDVIAGSLAPAIPMERMLRFVATHEAVLERIDDSPGHVDEVCHRAIATAGETAKRLAPDEAALLPWRIMETMGGSTHGYLVQVPEAVAPNQGDIRARPGTAADQRQGSGRCRIRAEFVVQRTTGRGVQRRQRARRGR